MTKTIVAGTIATDLRNIEHQTDDLLASAGTLLATMVQGRRTAGFAAEFAHPALISVGEAIQQGISMRSRLVQAHQRLASAANAAGIDVATLGPLEDKPEGTEGRPTGRLATEVA